MNQGDAAATGRFRAIIFDLGGVLIDWNPRYIYRSVFDSEEKMEWFLQHICTMDWNEQQDAGYPIELATREKIEEFPEWENEIRLYYKQWTEMLREPIHGTVHILGELIKIKELKCYALTNWSAELFPFALQRYDFLYWFDGRVVSGEEKMKKPEPEIFRVLLNRYNLEAGETVFVDDNIKNVQAADRLGIHAIQFKSPGQLRLDLKKSGIQLGPDNFTFSVPG